MPEQFVKHPSHYNIFPNISAIMVIASSSTEEEFRGFCWGNVLKYRLRLGNKDDVMQELAKAENYAWSLFEQYKPLCRSISLMENNTNA